VAGLSEKSVISPTLVGRAEQAAALRRALELARAGRGLAVLLAGEAGIGKTRLAREIGAEARRSGLTVLQGSCQEPDRSWPYAPLIDLLRDYLGRQPKSSAPLVGSELARLLPELSTDTGQTTRPLAEFDRYSLFLALERFLFGLAGEAPLVVIVEDIHWADDASLEALLHLARRLGGQRVLLVLTYRGEEAGASLGRFLLSLNRARLAEALALPALNPPEVDALLRAIFDQPRPTSAEFLRALYLLTEGNPFFIEEVLKTLLAAGDIFYRAGVWDRKPLQQLRIPASVGLAVEQRTRQLAPGAYGLLQQAAVVGRRFDFALLQELTGMDEITVVAHLKQLVAAQLIVEESDDQFAFRHALTREAVYGTLLHRERRQHHRAIAECLERLAGRAGRLEGVAADLAHHFFQAQAWDRAQRYAQAAGRHAQAMHAPREAAELYSRALEAIRSLGRPAGADLLRARGQAYETLGEFERAHADYEGALALAQAAEAHRDEWQCLLDLGFAWSSQDYARAGDYFRRALTLARDLDDPALLAHSFNRVGNWHVNVEQVQAARDHHLQALKLFEALNDTHGRAETLDLLGLTASMTGNFDEGFACNREAVALFEALNDKRGQAASLSVMGECGATYLTDAMSVAPIALAEAGGYARQALAITQAIGWRSGESYALSVASLCAGSQGHLAEAVELARRALDVAAEIEHYQWMAFAHVAYGLAWSSGLRLAPAREHFEQAQALAQAIHSAFWAAVSASLSASTCAAQGELDQAASLLAGDHAAGSAPLSFADKLTGAARVELSLARGDPAEAVREASRLMEAVVPSDPAPEQPWRAAPRLLKLYGESLSAAGRYPEAVLALEASVRACAAQGARPLQWRALAALGRCWWAQRRFEPAQSAFEMAASLVRELAAELPDEAWRQDFLQAALTFLPASTPGYQRRAAKQAVGGLTERERQVARLLAQGRANRDIAAALVLSERTVEKHISNILGKLGLTSRLEVAAWAHAHGLDVEVSG
jgi:DNA-binding CsgD family transcriptional regulator